MRHALLLLRATEAEVEPMPTITERINTDITTAMKAREEPKLTTLRMVKSALRSK